MRCLRTVYRYADRYRCPVTVKPVRQLLTVYRYADRYPCPVTVKPARQLLTVYRYTECYRCPVTVKPASNCGRTFLPRALIYLDLTVYMHCYGEKFTTYGFLPTPKTRIDHNCDLCNIMCVVSTVNVESYLCWVFPDVNVGMWCIDMYINRR